MFEVQKDSNDIDLALKTIREKKEKVIKDKDPIIEVYDHLDMLPLPQVLNPGGRLKILCIIDDCTIINSLNPTQLFVYCRPLNINTIYISQKYTKVPSTIRENTNVFILFKQSMRTIKENIFHEIWNQFESDKEMIEFFKLHINQAHNFIIYNK